MPEEVVARMSDRPLRGLSSVELYALVQTAAVNLDDPQQLRHFLPRILEWVSQNKWPEEPAAFMARVADGVWQSLRGRERSAIVNFLVATWSELLGNIAYPVSADSWLCAVAQYDISLSRFLNLWYFDWWHDESSRLRHLAQFMQLNFSAIDSRRELASAYWKRKPSKVDIVLGWLGNNREKLALIYRDHRSSLFAGDFYPIADRLADMCRTYWEARGVDYSKPDPPADDAIRKLFAAAYKAPDPYNVASAARAPLAMLLEKGQTNWFCAEMDRCLSVLGKEQNPIRRQDGLYQLLFAGGPRSAYLNVLEAFSQACSEARGGKTFLNLKYVALDADVVDHGKAVQLALMIKHTRTRRQVLRLLGERELADQHCDSATSSGA